MMNKSQTDLNPSHTKNRPGLMVRAVPSLTASERSFADLKYLL